MQETLEAPDHPTVVTGTLRRDDGGLRPAAHLPGRAARARASRSTGPPSSPGDPPGATCPPTPSSTSATGSAPATAAPGRWRHRRRVLGRGGTRRRRPARRRPRRRHARWSARCCPACVVAVPAQRDVATVDGWRYRVVWRPTGCRPAGSSAGVWWVVARGDAGRRRAGCVTPRRRGLAARGAEVVDRHRQPTTPAGRPAAGVLSLLALDDGPDPLGARPVRRVTATVRWSRAGRRPTSPARSGASPPAGSAWTGPSRSPTRPRARSGASAGCSASNTPALGRPGRPAAELDAGDRGPAGRRA